MIHLDESDCFNAWLSCGDAPDVTPKIIDGKRKDSLSYRKLVKANLHDTIIVYDSPCVGSSGEQAVSALSLSPLKKPSQVRCALVVG